MAGPRLIADKLFVNQLDYVRDLIIFLIRRQVDLGKQQEDWAALAELGTVRYSRRGTAASTDDWRMLYNISHDFMSQLTDESATSFAIWQTRGIYGLLPFTFLVGSLIALTVVFFDPAMMKTEATLNPWEMLGLFVSVLLWTCSLGGLGVSAFFGTSLLTQFSSNDTVDTKKWLQRITDKNYLRTRLALGILFAFVIGLPFGYPSLSEAVVSITRNNMNGQQAVPSIVLTILAPFLFGFSTTLVMAVLERVIEGVRTMLGAQGDHA